MKILFSIFLESSKSQEFCSQEQLNSPTVPMDNPYRLQDGQISSKDCIRICIARFQNLFLSNFMPAVRDWFPLPPLFPHRYGFAPHSPSYCARDLALCSAACLVQVLEWEPLSSSEEGSPPRRIHEGRPSLQDIWIYLYPNRNPGLVTVTLQHCNM